MENEKDEGQGESPRRARRRKNLEQLLADLGGAAQVARESGTPKSHFSAMLNRKRGLGDGLAEKLEKLYDKPVGWFDQVPGLQPEEQALLDAYRSLDPVGRAILLRAAGAMVPDAHAEQVLRDNIAQSGPRTKQLKRENQG